MSKNVYIAHFSIFLYKAALILKYFEYYVFSEGIFKSVSGHSEEEPDLSTGWGAREQKRFMSYFRQPRGLLEQRQKKQE